MPKTYHLPNAGLLNIDWAGEAITAQIFGEAPEAQIELRVPFGDLVV